MSMDNPVIGMSKSQWYCNVCQTTHYGDERCSVIKKKRDDKTHIVREMKI